MGRSLCCDKNGLKKGPWTAEEDTKLTTYIQLHGPGNWRVLPKNSGLQRCGKSCRLRWTNYLRPDIKRGKFSFEEEETIIQLHSVLGNKWSCIAARLPGRTDNEIKNYWNTHIRKRFLRNGIDPVTHAPRLDLLNQSPLLSSPQLNLYNLICINQALQNQDVLRLALNLGSLYNDLNSSDYLNQFENNNIIQQTPIIQNSTHEYIEGHFGHYNTSSTGQISQQEHFAPDSATTSHECFSAIVPDYSYGATNGSIHVEGESFSSSLPEGLDLENFM